MSTQTETTNSLVWFEIPADNVERAKSFYGALFGWKIEKFPGPMEYWHIDTGGADDTPDGGLMKRQNPGQQGITNYIAVASVDESAAKVEELKAVTLGQFLCPVHLSLEFRRRVSHGSNTSVHLGRERKQW